MRMKRDLNTGYWTTDDMKKKHHTRLSATNEALRYSLTIPIEQKVGFLIFLSNSCKRSPLACLLYKYNTYKGSVAEGAFQRMVNDKQDFCTVCGKDGLLICCDDCNRPYHLECADPPLSKLPEAEEKWFCKLCST